MPAASRSSSDCSVASASPPRCPRVPIERMKTPGSRKWSARRIRSPSSAPCVKGLEGSTEIDADREPERAHVRISAPISDDLPTPGGPVIADRERRAGLRIELLDQLPERRVAGSRRARSPARGPAGRLPGRRRRVRRESRAAGHRRHSTARARPFRTADAVVAGCRLVPDAGAAHRAIRDRPRARTPRVPQSPPGAAHLRARHLDGVLRGADRDLQPDGLGLVGEHPAVLRARAERDPGHRDRPADRPVAAPADDDLLRPRRRRDLRRAPVRPLARRDLRALGGGGLLGRVLPAGVLLGDPESRRARNPSSPRTRSCRASRTSRR